ncbi:hypothetical protein VSU01S_38600 [Vibrio superstes NBRC 103154]|uniref:Uncharacterized protein n=1 Tax=Vibrio superstes NBRC 103154 TaxID=1219062 RepID=A0A511QW75_9VIBR|nr:hypothetical protein VSU01S_38600 [Vibrio superstes NBRC 103154]
MPIPSHTSGGNLKILIRVPNDYVDGDACVNQIARGYGTLQP